MPNFFLQARSANGTEMLDVTLLIDGQATEYGFTITSSGDVEILWSIVGETACSKLRVAYAQLLEGLPQEIVDIQVTENEANAVMEWQMGPLKARPADALAR